jgi:hypothetical protein
MGESMSAGLFRLSGTVERDPRIDAVFALGDAALGALGRRWFECMRRLGPDVREVFHDGLATACIADAPFAAVGVFTRHVNVAFFQGATLPDPARLLRGTGVRMRHVKVPPGEDIDAAALEALIVAAYEDMRARVGRADDGET